MEVGTHQQSLREVDSSDEHNLIQTVHSLKRKKADKIGSTGYWNETFASMGRNHI
jgi:hypothetical protein